MIVIHDPLLVADHVQLFEEAVTLTLPVLAPELNVTLDADIE